jgi:hypothetical protein
MKRILAGFGLAVGMLAMGVTNASAAALCTLDPTYRIGLPVHYSIDLKVLGTHVYASGTSKTTTWGAVVGL